MLPYDGTLQSKSPVKVHNVEHWASSMTKTQADKPKNKYPTPSKIKTTENRIITQHWICNF